jgi:hypothetical protein
MADGLTRSSTFQKQRTSRLTLVARADREPEVEVALD